MRIRSSSTPGKAKRLGKRVVLRTDWEDVKLHVMRVGISLKFWYNPDLMRKLLDTGQQYLEEGNRWGDTYWGLDLCTGVGENHLGILLMEFRDSIRHTLHDTG
jgi:predicted NAD-dependent protein-ADP-ribosyltransferase YbiA (DUF1768 family)